MPVGCSSGMVIGRFVDKSVSELVNSQTRWLQFLTLHLQRLC